MSAQTIYSTASQQLTAYLTRFFDLSEEDRPKEAAEFRSKFLTVAGLACSHTGLVEMQKSWAEDSYVHANGFARLVVFIPECASFRLRMHVWPEGSGVENLNVHNHRYSFVSFVEQGAIEDVTWVPAETGDLFRRFTYTSRDATGNYHHQYSGEQNLCVKRRRRVVAGELYSLNCEQFHYSLPEHSSVTVTFFAEDRRRLQPSATTFSRHHNINEVDTYTPSISHEEYQSILGKYINCAEMLT